jgi:hypothetical protein
MKAAEAKRHVKHLVDSGALFPGDRDLAYAAVMLLTNHLPSNFRDFPDMERDWRRLADAIELMPEDYV